MNFNRHVQTLRKAALIGGVAIVALLFTSEVLARVGGGQGYGGGGGSGGGGGGGGAGALVYLLVRFLLWLTIEHPVVGIPIDIIVIGTVIYWFARPSKSVTLDSSRILAPDPVATAVQQQGFQREFNQLRRFDPNFSEIIFTDFCYALYGRAHDARGRDPKELDLLSPYLSEQARSSLLQLNPPNLKSVEGIIVGAMQVVGMQGLATPVVS